MITTAIAVVINYAGESIILFDTMSGNQKQFIEILLSKGFYSFLVFLFTLTFVSFLAASPFLAASLKRISRKSWFMVLLILLIDFLIWKWYTPHIPHIYYDQYAHLDLANNLFRHGLNAYTLAGSLKNCWSFSLCNAWPPGYHFILSVFFRLFGSTESIAFYCSLFFGLMSVFLFFIFIYLAAEKEDIALWSAFILTSVPVYLKYTATYSLEIPSLSFIFLTGISALLHMKYRNLRTLIFLITVFVCACYVRPENLLILSITCLLSCMPAMISMIRKKAFGVRYASVPVILSGLILAVPLALLYYYSFTYMKPPGWNTEPVSYLDYFKMHVLDNLLFFVKDYHPAVLTAITVGGMVIIILRKGYSISPVIIKGLIFWFTTCLVLYSSYHTGDFYSFSDSDRYSLNLYITISFFAAITMSWSMQQMKKQIRIFCIIASAFIILYSSQAPLSNLELKTLQRPLFSEYEFIKSNCFKTLDPAIPVICTANPAKVFFFHNVKVMNFNYFMNNMNLIDRAVFFQDLSWYMSANDSRNFQEMQRAIQDNYHIEPIEFRDIDKCRVGLFLLTKRSKNKQKIIEEEFLKVQSI